MLLGLYSTRTGKILATGKNVHEVLKKYISKAFREHKENNDETYSDKAMYIHIARYVISMYLKGHISTEIY